MKLCESVNNNSTVYITNEKTFRWTDALTGREVVRKVARDRRAVRNIIKR